MKKHQLYSSLLLPITTIIITCAENPFAPSDPITDIEGNVYKTVNIGNQIWMAENLKTMTLNDGTSIMYSIPDSEWNDLQSPGGCWYKNDSGYKSVYGGLYNHLAVKTGKLAPKGWHVPTQAEWLILSNFVKDCGKLKEAGTVHWVAPNSGATNESGFTALPGGIREYNNSFVHMDSSGYWWCAETPTGPNYRNPVCLLYNYRDLETRGSYFAEGLSVRCVKD
jgi:uncharacterized protein (TIGR02145 family)